MKKVISLFVIFFIIFTLFVGSKSTHESLDLAVYTGSPESELEETHRHEENQLENSTYTPAPTATPTPTPEPTYTPTPVPTNTPAHTPIITTTPKPVEATPKATEAPVEDLEVDSTGVSEVISELESELVYLGNFILTAYCPDVCCNGEWAWQTSTGVVPTEGRTIAVDPKVIPYGTEVIINGHSYIAEDCGVAIKNNKIDICFDTHGEVDNFGVQYAGVYIKK